MKKIFISIVLLMILVGCKNESDPIKCESGYKSENGFCVFDDDDITISSSDDIMTIYSRFNQKQQIINNYSSRFTFATDDVATDTQEDTTDFNSNDTDSKNDSGSDDYSETNNQVEGVDEMDNVLTDGKYIYIQNSHKVQIILAYSNSTKTDVLNLEKEIFFNEIFDENKHFYPNGMYVDNNRLLIIGNTYTYTCTNEIDSTKMEDQSDIDSTSKDYGDDYIYDDCKYYEYHNNSHVLEYSKDDFKLINTYELSGNVVGTRKIGNNLYFVTNEYIPFHMANRENSNFSLDNYLPQYSINESETKISYNDILYVEDTNPSTFTTFYGIDLQNKVVDTEVVLGEGGYNLFVSSENIYLTATKWNYNYDVLYEIDSAIKEAKTIEITENPYEIETSILKVSINNGNVNYVTESSVPGVSLDQFAMDENDGYLRIVTTTRNWWWFNSNSINNRLMILDENLDLVSTIENIGKEGESVQSTRFVGDYAYVVTFLNTDPFYVFDLSDPNNPTKLSELEIPGFSDYLQPIGENYILGIGYGDNDGGTRGLKISLYDVSDKTNAIVASEIVYPYNNNSYMWTSTLYNHKDLLVSINKELIALPYTLSDYSDNHWSYHTGVLILNLDIESGKISEKARVEHSESENEDTYVYKSKFISEYIYTISNKYVIASTINNPDTILNKIEIGIDYNTDSNKPVDTVD